MLSITNQTLRRQGGFILSSSLLNLVIGCVMALIMLYAFKPAISQHLGVYKQRLDVAVGQVSDFRSDHISKGVSGYRSLGNLNAELEK